jgi:uncharacterized protein YbbK (DUF523 family)
MKVKNNWQKRLKILVSACLLGVKCRFDGKDALDEKLISILKKIHTIVIGVCPEEIGGLIGIRGPFEIVGESSKIWQGKAKIIDREGFNMSRYFINGANTVCKIATLNNIDFAILKSNSPACSSEFIYDGTFKNRLKKGMGICAYLLKKKGVKVISENEFKNKFRYKPKRSKI